MVAGSSSAANNSAEDRKADRHADRFLHSTGVSSPLVTVGLPVFNGERFIARAIESLLAQTHRQIRLVISDNASNDGTEAICRRYSDIDNRVIYVRQRTNVGAPRNWNFVFDQADGPYFKWASSNDECAPQMVELCVRALEQRQDAVLAQGRTCLVDEDTGERETYQHDLSLNEDDPYQRFVTLCQKLALNNGQSGVIRTAALRRTGLDRPYAGGDFPLMAELALQGKFILLPQVLLFRRMGASTFSAALTDEASAAFFGRRQPTPRGDVLRGHWDLLLAIAGAPTDAPTKARAFAYGIRRLIWDRHRLFAST